ncbi:MAG TPA: DUF302 domain-containing protein [Verrucomicrobiae bacterium]|nr:DUF302 domain-containing protein [Verrucomicrobiae bacterium]
MNSSALHPANHPFASNRIEWRLNQPFAKSLQRLLTILGKPHPLRLLVYARLGGKAGLEHYLEKVGGELGLMILGTVRHGFIMSALNGPSHAQMFLIGNPLTAVGLMREFKQAGVYAPMRVMFHDDGMDRTIITYDAPSKVFGQFDSPQFLNTGEMLERKLEALVREIAIS